MKKIRAIKTLFVVSVIYDGLLGLSFLFAASKLFKWFDVTPPNHMGYIHFPAALLIVFAVMFGAIARNPVRNHNLIPYGIMLKVAYCGVVFFHWFSKGIPYMWKPFCVADMIFLLLFLWSWIEIKKMRKHKYS
ncbi:MAG: hypothetical protein GX811_11845 [Lentisphaerae bacterium]|nr:hypothetical protein [Lentisphaerota bacterium]